MNVEKIEEILAREELQIAPLWKRFVAFVIDELLISMIILGIAWEEISQNSQDIEIALEIVSDYTFSMFIIAIVYHWLFVKFYGATIGKMVVKIKVVEVALLDNPSLMQSFLRSLVRFLSMVLFYIPFLFILNSRVYQALHDRIVNTIVIELK
ncbi:RDD family protein [Helicobacter mesocricetorum]|uniref:RDD family protein n=1 Tax=Helicobacter mesocricetorum TaxID=87012 RepID=UPI000CF1AD77|nr:RDD family protein [Helicobacter mesocricetorum]